MLVDGIAFTRNLSYNSVSVILFLLAKDSLEQFFFVFEMSLNHLFLAITIYYVILIQVIALSTGEGVSLMEPNQDGISPSNCEIFKYFNLK